VKGALDRERRRSSRSVARSGLGWAARFGINPRPLLGDGGIRVPVLFGSSGGQQLPRARGKARRSGSRGVHRKALRWGTRSVETQAQLGCSSLKCRLQKSARRISGSRSGSVLRGRVGAFLVRPESRRLWRGVAKQVERTGARSLCSACQHRVKHVGRSSQGDWF
jgi:hypothetical protein